MIGVKLVATAFLIVVTALCRPLTEPNAPSFFTATIGASVQSQYNGTGTFNRIPHGAVRFTLHSQGVGESAYEGISLHAADVPGIGEYLIGELSDTTFRATYWRDEPGEREMQSRKREIFAMHSGVIRISESRADRVAGEFSMQAALLYDCTLDPGYPGPFLNCKPAQEQAEIEMTGSFEAIPLARGRKGLTRSYD